MHTAKIPISKERRISSRRKNLTTKRERRKRKKT
jgi:hypothetical protein